MRTRALADDPRVLVAPVVLPLVGHAMTAGDCKYRRSTETGAGRSRVLVGGPPLLESQ